MKTVVLLSGGLDSAVNLCIAAQDTEVSTALTFDYGQRAAAMEIAASASLCERHGVRHEIIALPWLGRITSTALVDKNLPLPEPCDGDLDGGPASTRSAGAVWVPNRNAVFASIGAAFAEASGAGAVVAGFNAEEGISFPDNSAAFVEAVNSVLSLSTLSRVKLLSYTIALDKRSIVELGLSRGAFLGSIWSCYGAGPTHCMRCESCRRLDRALRCAGAISLLEERK